MKKVTGLLREWGEFVAANLDFADEYGESILYRSAQLGGYVDVGQSSHKVLCADMPTRLREVDRAVRRLPKWEKSCITVFFCSPLKEDGNPYTKRELSRLLQTSKYNFDSHLSRGKRRLEIKLKIA